MKLSARNVLPGQVSEVTKGAVNALVGLTLKGGAKLYATITNASVDNLGLAAGKEATAIIKASNVIIAQNLGDTKFSARNLCAGKVVKVVDGPVNAEVDLEIGPGLVISAVITEGSAKAMGIKVGDSATAIVKASSVILGA